MPALPGVQTSAGTKLRIGTTAANMATDAYVEIGEVTSIPEFGRQYTEVTHTSLGSRDVKKYKGRRNDGSVTIPLARDLNDAGQDSVRAKLDSDFDYNFEIELNDKGDGAGATNSFIRFKAKVMGFPLNIGNDEQVIGHNLMLGIKTGSIAETEATAGT